MVELSQGLQGTLTHLPPRDKPQSTGLHPEQNVFLNGQMRREGKLLVYHTDALLPGIKRVPRPERFPAQEHIALIRVMGPGEDFHQRGLPSTVFTYKGVHLAWQDRKINAI